MILLSVNAIEACERTEHLGNLDVSVFLVVLQKGCNNARECKGTAVQRVNELGLKYRILRLCGGDMSFTSAITYDFELWSAAQGRWLEISSVSNFESYQANRLKCRYKDETGKMQLCHTLNGSSLALPRVVAALLEDNQKDGYIEIPEVLRPFTGFDRID